MKSGKLAILLFMLGLVACGGGVGGNTGDGSLGPLINESGEIDTHGTPGGYNDYTACAPGSATAGGKYRLKIENLAAILVSGNPNNPLDPAVLNFAGTGSSPLILSLTGGKTIQLTALDPGIEVYLLSDVLNNQSTPFYVLSASTVGSFFWAAPAPVTPGDPMITFDDTAGPIFDSASLLGEETYVLQVCGLQTTGGAINSNALYFQIPGP